MAIDHDKQNYAPNGHPIRIVELEFFPILTRFASIAIA